MAAGWEGEKLVGCKIFKEVNLEDEKPASGSIDFDSHFLIGQLHHTPKPNERCVGFWAILGKILSPFYIEDLQNSITIFSIGPLLSLEKYVRQRFF